jgi:hypothetical protein
MSPSQFPSKPGIASICLVVLTAATLLAQPVVTITDDLGSLPDESYFAAHPTAIVNVEDGGVISPGEIANPFDFHGATVNLNNQGALGWFTLQPFVDDVAMNLYDGGTIHDRATFSGVTGTTVVTVHGGFARGRLNLLGNSTLYVNGGMVGGGQPQGAASIIAEDTSRVTIAGGVVEDYVTVRETAELQISGGEVGDFLAVEGSGKLTVSGGTLGRLTHVRGADARVEITGGTIGREFMLTAGEATVTGGAIDENSLIRDSVMNMTGGVLGRGFKVFNGTLNMSGGTFGDNFRLGAFGGSPGTLNLFVKSVTIDGDPLPLAIGETAHITRRDKTFLVAELVKGGSVGLLLSDTISNIDDYLRADSTLTVTRQADPSDFDLDGDVDDDDLAAWDTGFGGGLDGGSLLAWQRSFAPTAATALLTAAPVPEPSAAVLVAMAVGAWAAGRHAVTAKRCGVAGRCQ